MDELNEAYLDRLVSKLDSQFENVNDFDKLEYARRIKRGLNKVVDDSFYKTLKNGYREMGNNYIDRSVLRELGSEYREVVEYIDSLTEEDEVDKLNVIKELERKLKDTSFHDVKVTEYEDAALINNGFFSITIYIEPLRGLGIFSIPISFNTVTNELVGLDIITNTWDHKQIIEDYDTEHSSDVYEKNEFNQTISVRHNNFGYDQNTPLV